MNINTRNNLDNSPEVWLKAKVKGIHRELAVCLAWALVSGVVVVIQARILSLTCQKVVIEKAGLPIIMPLIAAVALLAVMRALLAFFAERQSVFAAAKVKQQVRSDLYRKLQLSGPAGMAGEETAPLVEAVTSGVEGLEPYFSRFIPHLLLAAFLPLIVLLFVFPADWRGGAILLFSAPFIPLLMVLIGRGSESLNRRQWGRLSRMSGHLLDLVQGLPDLKIFSAARREAELVAKVSDEYRRGTMGILRVAFLSAFVLEFFATAGTAVVAVVIGFRLLGGALTLVDGLFVLLLAPEFYLPFRTLGLSYHSRMQGMAAAERISALMDMPMPDSVCGSLPVPEAPHEIRFHEVTYRYGADRGGITAIDLTLPAGCMTIVTGESGTGKTTLVRLLVSLVRPEAGQITVNGTNIELLRQEEWQSGIAWVPQFPYFFKGTIRENVLLGCPDAKDDAIRAALKVASADFVDLLPLGLDTILGNRGAGLSGGELRRLALVRAFLRDASIVVMDEPTAGLDPENERIVGEALSRYAADRTVMVISHREQTIRRGNRVVVMNGGRVERIVSPGEFLAAGMAA